MEDDEKEFTLRDKMAIEMLNITCGNGVNNSAFREFILFANANTPTEKQIFEEHANTIMHRMRGAYKLADLMRKIRLEIFS